MPGFGLEEMGPAAASLLSDTWKEVEKKLKGKGREERMIDYAGGSFSLRVLAGQHQDRGRRQ